jgi:hypothetical protein
MWTKCAKLTVPALIVAFAGCAAHPALRADGASSAPAMMVTGSRIPQKASAEAAPAAASYPVQTVTGAQLQQTGRRNAAAALNALIVH